jgi:tetratricopeptide (TPR) repeat protein
MGAELPTLEALSPAERARLTALRNHGISPEERYHRGALAQWSADLGRYREAWDLAAPFRAGESGMTARGLIALGWTQAALGRPAEARRAVAAARTIYRASGQHSQLGWAFAHELQYIVLPYEAERVAERRGLAAEAEGQYARASDVVADVPPRIAYAELLALEGGWGEARGLAMRGRASSYVAFRAESASVQARIARWQGDRELAWAAVRECLVAGPAAEPGSTYFLPSMELLQVAAALALDDGDLAAARGWLAAHDQWLSWSGSVRYRAEGAIGWATYHRAMADLALARQHAERALTHAAEPRQPLSLLAAHRLLGEQDTAAGRYDDASESLDVALALAHACEAPYERALTLLALAELRLAQGEGVGAGQTLNEALALLEALEARPALARAARLTTTRPVPAYLPDSPRARRRCCGWWRRACPTPGPPSGSSSPPAPSTSTCAPSTASSASPRAPPPPPSRSTTACAEAAAPPPRLPTRPGPQARH